ncbi:Crp/Fnr family transcriptional regulator [Desertivirga arenae]|uniref:Crp/Fnr family transcriptional regulator n=1 Tax=Desertivirga arenae TaxID=2810309 RepID=UPI001A973CEA|nr:Crp/Fnr family transcriptional regulator [Pedobacter sp. SYSU D00823]
MQKPSQLQLLVYRRFLEQFVVFTDEQWEIFCNELQLKKIKKKEFLIEAGKVCNEVAFILRGAIRYYHVKDGEEITNYFSLENEMVSAYKSFLTQKPSAAYIEAIENTQAIIFNKSSLEKLLEDERINMKMERFGRVVAETVLCCYDDRVTAFIIQTPEERYVSLLESGSPILTRIPQHYIANYLGITPVSLSRIRRRVSKPNTGLRFAAS